MTPYTFRGFLGGLLPFPALNPITAGTTIALHFGLGGDFGLNIFAPSSPVSTEIACGSTAPADATQPTVSPKNNGLVYDRRNDVYSLAWKTDKAWAGTCRQFVLTLKDSNKYRVNVSFR